MAEYISREAALAFQEEVEPLLALGDNGVFFATTKCADLVKYLQSIPAADVREVVKAKWEDVHIDRPEIADLEVASMFCPNCNRWHNEVYHYGNPIEFANYCQFCGADMREES